MILSFLTIVHLRLDSLRQRQLSEIGILVHIRRVLLHLEVVPRVIVRVIIALKRVLDIRFIHLLLLRLMINVIRRAIVV